MFLSNSYHKEKPFYYWLSFHSNLSRLNFLHVNVNKTGGWMRALCLMSFNRKVRAIYEKLLKYFNIIIPVHCIAQVARRSLCEEMFLYVHVIVRVCVCT